MLKPKNQRILDPVHNLIEFDSNEFEHTLWQVIQTRPFQRLRRIKQLGFSELVFPGATHTRFAHSIGVFHVARNLMKVIKCYLESNGQQFGETQARHTMAAALLHDVGHGMFSHAFEDLGKQYNWPAARHAKVSETLIRDSELTEVLDKAFLRGFAGNVADIIARDTPADLYGSVVSSQFDADRLDYMLRDRQMTGVQSSGVDLTWLLANLEVDEVAEGTDEANTGKIETLVLGPKAVRTAESYLLGLFHLYPNVYLHKTTRGAEKVFQAIIRRLVELQSKGHLDKSGLQTTHPILEFIADPKDYERAMNLDDTVFLGALPMLVRADDEPLVRFSKALQNRQVLKCHDIIQMVEQKISVVPGEDRKRRIARVSKICKSVADAIKSQDESNESSHFLVDEYKRDPYKRFQESNTPLNQVHIRSENGDPIDMADFSPVIAHAEPFELCRVYTFRDDNNAECVIKNIIGTKIEGEVS